MPIEFFRGVIELIGVACAWMAARNVVMIRRGRQDPRRVYGWFARTLLCVVAAAIRHPLGMADFIFWSLCVLAFGGRLVAGVPCQTSGGPEPRDLSRRIVE